MNEKRMHIASNATAMGIVSLYNKGFVPKKTGKVSRKSNFASVRQTKTLYDTQEEREKEQIRKESQNKKGGSDDLLAPY